MSDVSLTIDGHEVTVPAGTLILDAAAKVGVDIPIFCSYDKLVPFAGCRMCLVEVEKWPKLVPACATAVMDGMVVHTENEKVAEARKAQLEYILINHPLDCPVCDKGGECDLQDLTAKYGPPDTRFVFRKHEKEHHDLSPYVKINYNRCILCLRCTRYTKEIAQDDELAVINRGVHSHIGTFNDKQYGGHFTGNVVALCPVGALTSKPFRFKARIWDIVKTPGVCDNCAHGCNTEVQALGGKLVKRIWPRRNEAVDEGWLCDKGWFCYDHIANESRIKSFQVKKDGAFADVRFEELYETVRKFKAESEAGSTWGVASGRVSNEDGFVFGRFMRELMGTENLAHQDDTSSLLAANTLGAAPDVSYDELMKPGTAVLTYGADLYHEQPLLHLRLKAAADKGDVTLLHLGETSSETARFAQAKLVSKPDTSAFALAWLMHLMLNDPELKRRSKKNVKGQEQFKESLGGGTFNDAAGRTGLTLKDIRAFGAKLMDAQRVFILVGESITHPRGMSDGHMPMLMNLGLLTGAYENGGVLPVLRHANSRGLTDMGLATGFKAGMRPSDTDKRLLDSDEPIDLLWILDWDLEGEGNDDPRLKKVIQRARKVVYQGLFMNATAEKADVVIPLAANFESTGTLTSFEGRVQAFQKSVDAPGEAKEAWKVLTRLSRYFDKDLGYDELSGVHEAIVKAVPYYKGLDTLGMDTEGLLVRGRPKTAETPRMAPFTNGRPDQKDGSDYPVRVVFSRRMNDSAGHSGMSDFMRWSRPEHYIALNRREARRWGLKDGELVTVSTLDGKKDTTLVVDRFVPDGVALLPWGFPQWPLEEIMRPERDRLFVRLNKAGQKGDD